MFKYSSRQELQAFGRYTDWKLEKGENVEGREETGKKRSRCRPKGIVSVTQCALQKHRPQKYTGHGSFATSTFPTGVKEYCFVPLFPHLKFFVKFVSVKVKSRALWHAN